MSDVHAILLEFMDVLSHLIVTLMEAEEGNASP